MLLCIEFVSLAYVNGFLISLEVYANEIIMMSFHNWLNRGGFGGAVSRAKSVRKRVNVATLWRVSLLYLFFLLYFGCRKGKKVP